MVLLEPEILRKRVSKNGVEKAKDYIQSVMTTLEWFFSWKSILQCKHRATKHIIDIHFCFISDANKQI